MLLRLHSTGDKTPHIPRRAPPAEATTSSYAVIAEVSKPASPATVVIRDGVIELEEGTTLANAETLVEIHQLKLRDSQPEQQSKIVPLRP
ncbi:MAG: hypothetical protein AAGG01_24460 [Planctomycetota bacterium]